MENILLIYNIIMTVIFTVSITGFYLLYTKNKSKLYLYTSLLFVLLLIDNSLVYLSEFSSSFSQLYESGDFIYIVIYSIFIGIFYTGRLIISEYFEDKISKLEHLIFLMILTMLLVINLVGSYTMSELLVYSSFYIGMSYIAVKVITNKRRRDGDHRYKLKSLSGIVIVLILILCIAGIIESGLYFMTYEDSTSIDNALSLDYRNIAFDIIKLIICIVGVKHLDNGFESIFSQSKSRVKNSGEKLDEFCAEYQLTSRQKEIISLIVDGDSNKEISSKLHITEGTVKTHIYNIFKKTEISSRNQLVSKIMNR